MVKASICIEALWRCARRTEIGQMEILGVSSAAVIDGEPCEAREEMKMQTKRRNLTFDYLLGVEVASGSDTEVSSNSWQAEPRLSNMKNLK